MKSIFIAFDQAHHEDIMAILSRNNARGFSKIEQVQGRGTKTGDPHYGDHAWPGMCSALLTIVEDRQVDPILRELKELDESVPQLGLRAFVWNIEQSI